MEGYYEDWVLRERERLRNRYLYGLAFLMSAYHLKGNLEASLACGQKILQQEPLREEIHRAMMRLYFQAGQRAMAIQQYELCCAALKAELEITPMPETEMLFQRIVHHAGMARSTASAFQTYLWVNRTPRSSRTRFLNRFLQLPRQLQAENHRSLQRWLNRFTRRWSSLTTHNSCQTPPWSNSARWSKSS
jgi:DNA-binding SARP family transcriptional activator